MPFSTFDPLGNPRTSQVLIHIISGVDTPTRIGKKMGVGPSAVTDHLNRLRKIRVVRLGEKTGKDQHYEIDWRALVSSTIYYGLVGRPIPPECLLFKEKIDMGNATESRCMNSEVFRRFTESYMRKRLAWFESHSFHGETYDQFITDFSRAIVKMCDELKYKPGRDSSQKRKNSEELAKVFGVWRDWHISIADSAREPFLAALKEVTETE